VTTARENLAGAPNTHVVQHDLTTFDDADGFDLVYCIGVLHHLKEPEAGFAAVVRNVRPGGRFHCWVYAFEGNAVIRLVVDPIRKVASRLPWWVTKYAIATPLVVPFYLYAKALAALRRPALARLPLHDYALWIAQRGFAFFRHVAFDQLVTPQTTYLRRSTVEQWLASDPRIDPNSTYVIFRNGNSWKFGGRTIAAPAPGAPPSAG
jgi:SAM-dependent methyltransferase